MNSPSYYLRNKVLTKRKQQQQDSIIILLTNLFSSYKITRWNAVTATIIQKIPPYKFGFYGYVSNTIEKIKHSYTFQVLTDNEGNLFSLMADGSHFPLEGIVSDFNEKIANFKDLPHPVTLKTSDGVSKLKGFKIPLNHMPQTLMDGFSNFFSLAHLNGEKWIAVKAW